MTGDEEGLRRAIHGKSLWLSPEVFIAHAALLFQLAPEASEIRFFSQRALEHQQKRENNFNYFSFLIFQEMSGYGTLPATVLREVASRPQLARVTSLLFNSNTLGNEGVKTLVESPHLTSLAKLELCQTNIGDQGVQALLQWTGIRQLRHLLLSRNAITDQGITAIAECSGLVQLTELGLSENPIHEEGLQALIGSPYLTGLQTLGLSGTPIGPEIEYQMNDNGFNERVGYNLAAAERLAKRFRHPVRIC